MIPRALGANAQSLSTGVVWIVGVESGGRHRHEVTSRY